MIYQNQWIEIIRRYVLFFFVLTYHVEPRWQHPLGVFWMASIHVPASPCGWGSYSVLRVTCVQVILSPYYDII